MPQILLIVVTGLTLLIADAVMLTNVLKPLFTKHLGMTLLDNIRPLQAALFYVIYMTGITWFAGWPALRDGTSVTALINRAILDFIAYGTYELTSWTVMPDWHPSMVAVDMVLGTILTAVSVWIGVMAARTI